MPPSTPPPPPHDPVPLPAAAAAPQGYRSAFEPDDTVSAAQNLQARTLPQIAGLARQCDALHAQIAPLLSAVTPAVAARFDQLSPVPLAKVRAALATIRQTADALAS